MEPFIGEIRLLPYDFAPRGWALCDGQLIPISSNTALFSILGTTYGGDGKATFGLPNLIRSVVPGAGQGPGLKEWVPGMRAGEDTVTLTGAEMPAHNHDVIGLNAVAGSSAPSDDDFLARDKRGGEGVIRYLAPGTTTIDVTLAPQALSASGGSQPHENRQPFLALNFCIALKGIFPRRP